MNAILSAIVAAIQFVMPQAGAQAIGVQPIEITTTIANIDRVDFYVDGQLAGAARKPPFRIMHDFGTALGAHTIEAKVYSNTYRNVAATKIETASLAAGEVLNVNYVEVPLRARSSRLLKKEDFVVRENGVQQSIRALQPGRGPARFVFVVDRSLSMSGGKLDAALRATNAQSRQLREGDRAEIVLFNHIVSQPVALSHGIDSVTPSGGTSLRDAVSSIASDERTYVIAITDGGDRNSETSEDEALKKISRARTVVDAIILGDRSPFLERAASNTGGTTVRATAASLDSALRDMLADINSRYQLGYQSNVHGTAWRAIEIRPVGRGISILSARKGYFGQ